MAVVMTGLSAQKGSQLHGQTVSASNMAGKQGNCKMALLVYYHYRGIAAFGTKMRGDEPYRNAHSPNQYQTLAKRKLFRHEGSGRAFFFFGTATIGPLEAVSAAGPLASGPRE